MTKLMIVIHGLRGGGSERVLVNLLKRLDRKEFAVTLVLYERVFDYPCPDDVDLKVLDISTGSNTLKLTASFVAKAFNLARLIRARKPEVIFSLLSSTNVTVILAKLLSRVQSRVIVSEHTHPSVNLANETHGWITEFFVKKFYPSADKIIAVSEGIKRDLVSNFSLSGTKIEVVYNPLDMEEIERLSKESVEHPWFKEQIPLIVSVGRLTKQKGYPHLLNAFSLVRKHLLCRLAIIGDGEDKPKLLNISRDLGIEKDIEFLGFQKNPFKYMARSSLFVLSSLYEGFGNVIVEAMALGLPVVSTDCPSGPSEIIRDKKNGLLVPVKDEQALVGAIISVMTDQSLRESLGREARQRANDFAIEKIVKEYSRVFNENSPSPL